MILRFRPIQSWPPGWERGRPPSASSPFRASYRDTLDLLERELAFLGATDITLQVDASERDCRLDGQLRADARIRYDGVILSFRTAKHGTLSYPCNRFSGWGTGRQGWQENLRAIALGLEALRKVERYGIADRGQQYAGWAALPPGIAMGRAMTVEEAADLLARESGLSGSGLYLLDCPEEVEVYFRAAAKRHHPDSGGDAATFRRITEARELLRRNAS